MNSISKLKLWSPSTRNTYVSVHFIFLRMDIESIKHKHIRNGDSLSGISSSPLDFFLGCYTAFRNKSPKEALNLEQASR